MHLGSEYQVRVAAWLAVEMLAGRQGQPCAPGGTIQLLRGETQESVDDLLVGTVEEKYGFIQAKRKITFSDKLNSDFASVIDQMVRQVTVKAPESAPRPWRRELSSENDRLMLVTSSLSSDKIRVVLRDVLKRARSLAPGQPLSDAAVTESEQSVLKITISTVRSFWKSATGKDATEKEVQSLLALTSVEVIDIEEGQLAEREAKRTLASMIISDPEQEGSAWSSVLKACRKMVTGRSGLDLESLKQQLQNDGIPLKAAGLSQKDIERNRTQSEQIDKLIDEARDAIRQYDYPRCKLLLERIERDYGSQLNTVQRFRVISNHGFAAIGQGKPGQAAKRFLEALALQPEDEKARTNEVHAYYVIGDFPTAFAKADKIRPLYPASTQLASHWVLASPPEKSVKDLESELSSILLEDHHVRLALADKALTQRDLDTAKRHAEKATNLDPNRGQPRVVSAQICMARIMDLESGRTSQSHSRSAILESAERHAREAVRLAEIDKDTRTQIEAQVLLVDILVLLGKKKEATEEADRAHQLDPQNFRTLLARSQAQFENDLVGEGIASLQRAYAIEPRADVAFNYGRALFTRSKENDLQTSIAVLTGIDLTTVFPFMRHEFALQTLKSIMKARDWEKAKLYLDNVAPQLDPETLSVLRGLLAHYQGLPQEAESHSLAAQSGLTSSTRVEVKIQLGRLFMLINRPEDALPLFQEAFDANVAAFDPGMLLDCAARQRRDDVVIETFRTLRKRGVKDWNTVSFGVQYIQKWKPSEASDVLNEFISENPTHRLAKLYRSVLGILSNRPELVSSATEDIPAVEELPIDHIMQVVHVLRFVGDADGAVDYAYRYLRLHFKEANAHRAFLVSMSPFEPMPNIQATLERVEVGSAVRYEEQPTGDPDWIVIEDTDDPSSDLKEISASSRIAKELIGKKVDDRFVLAPGMIDRHAVIRQIVPKYVRAYNDCGDRWQIRFPEEPMIQSVHLGKTEEEVREGVERMLQVLQKRAESEVEMRKRYNTVSTPLHIFGKWHGENSYSALLALALSDDQPLRTSFGTQDERKEALEALKAAKALVLDLSAVATLRLLELEKVLTKTHFRFQLTENSWRELRETLREDKANSPSIAIDLQDGKRVMLEETVDFKKKRAAANRAYLELVEKHCEIVAVEEVAWLPPTKREQFEQLFGQYGIETMLLAAKPGSVLWSDDLVQSQVAATEFGARKAWTQVLLTFLAEQSLVSANERDAATARLIGMEYQVTYFDALSFVEAVHLTGARPWKQPLKTFIRELSAPEADLNVLFPILEECIVRIYREALLPENRCSVTTALLDAMWKNPAARRSILNLRAKSARMFLLNPVGESQFNVCFDQWLKPI